MSDSLCEMRWTLAVKQIDLYERVIGLDSANAEDRAMQVAVWKTGYESSRASGDACKKRIEELEKLLAKENKRKKRWRGVALGGIPVALVGGVFFVLLR